MSVATPAQVTSQDGFVRSSDAPALDRVRRHAGPAALVVGSLLAVVGMTLHVPGAPEDEALVRTVAAHPTQWLVSHLLQSFGLALVAAGAVTAVRLAYGRGATLTAAGAAVTAVGAALMSLGDIAHGAVAFALVDHVEVATSLAIQKAYFYNPAIAILSMGGMLLPIGVLVLAAGVLRSRVVARSAAIVLLISPIAVQVAFAAGLPISVLGLPFVVGMTALARAIARG